MSSIQFEAQMHWLHIFQAMIEQGYIAEIGPHAFAVYIVIKSHVNYHSGVAYPSIERISKLSGVSKAQVKRALRVLEKSGLIIKSKVGRSNVYTLREKVIINMTGQPHTVAYWSYVPRATKNIVAELKKAISSGDFTGTQTLTFKRLNTHTYLTGGRPQLDPTGHPIDWEKMAPSVKITLRKHLKLPY